MPSRAPNAATGTGSSSLPGWEPAGSDEQLRRLEPQKGFKTPGWLRGEVRVQLPLSYHQKRIEKFRFGFVGTPRWYW